ncbi:MAG TPA: transcription antitermination factor NusB [Acidobacteriota bacterium]|nr:transcription antitermination factor NusB [Acidobacteriota bacterium]
MSGEVVGVASRALALGVLLGVERGGRSDRLLDAALRASTLEPRDRRLATEIVYGALRRQATLDRTVTRFCDQPFPRLEPVVRCALRLAAYQCAYLKSVPPHAAVFASVEATKQRLPRAAGLVNGVLRAWLRAGALLDEGDGSLAARLDVPAWLAQRWLARYGEVATERWWRAALEPAPRALRIHPRKLSTTAALEMLDDAGVVAEPSPAVDSCVRVGGGSLAGCDAVRQGLMTPRSEASQLVTELLPPGDGWTVDACAGRGGKSVQLAEAGAPGVLAIDIDVAQLADAEAAASRAATPEVRAVCADLTSAFPVRRRFDRILVDAPCSGLGTVRRHPEIKWRLDASRLGGLARRQRQLLSSAVATLEPGGVVLYVTCSTEPEENDAVIDAVMRSCPDVRAQPLEGASLAAAIGDDGYFRTYPGEPQLDGFFAALLRREPRG